MCIRDSYKSNPARKNHINIDGLEFHTGAVITPYLAEAEYYAVMVATAGHEFQKMQFEVKDSGDIYKEFLLDSIGSAIAESVAACTCQKIEEAASCQEYGVSFPYSPGYCGWHVSEQQKLFSLFPVASPCGIQLTDSSLMIPIKSVSGIIGVGSHVRKLEYTCGLCTYENCFRRK